MNLDIAIKKAAQTLLNTGRVVESKKWQAIESPKKMLEALFVDFKAKMPDDLGTLVKMTKPNLPWADIHFEERVGYLPLNPGDSYKVWPFYGRDDKMRPGDIFSHTYMERIWPKWAGKAWLEHLPENEHTLNKGIRFSYGDLRDVVNQLIEDIHTRQAYLPIWFPEDTGATDRRVPCTIGYHFMIRGGYLHLDYHIRSCDLLRHFQDDIYLAIRLAMWVANLWRIKGQDKTNTKWPKLKMGMFNMHIGSLHIFEPEVNRVKTQFGL